MGEFLLPITKAHPLRNITRVNRDRGRVARGVLVSCVERRDERRGKREVRTPESGIRIGQGFGCLALLPVEKEQALRSERGNREQDDAPRRERAIRVCKDRYDWGMK